VKVDQLAPPEWAASLALAMKSRDITEGNRADMFLAQCAHESGGFKRFSENLNYSAAALIRAWPTRFPTWAIADHYATKAPAIANRAYADRMGNGNEQSGDGWKYRGRGLIQLTGRANYGAAGDALRLPLVTEPDIAETPSAASQIAAWFWYSKGCNALADAGDFEAITKKINGGLNGLEDRERWLAKVRAL